VSETEIIDLGLSDLEFDTESRGIPRAVTSSLAIVSRTPTPPVVIIRDKRPKPITQNPTIKKKPVSVNYRTVLKDLSKVQAGSITTSCFNRRYSDVLRNQFIRAHIHTILELALKFEDFRKRFPCNKDTT